MGAGVPDGPHLRAWWLRFDLVAGVVLAAILVPQGMAYAELAGLPPVTGLYTTIACLVGYALFGPSRVLVLGPDSSISPLIFAAITPLLARGRRPGNGDRAGRDAGRPRRPHRDRARARQARLRRRPALQGGAGRLHERPGDHDHRRPAAEAVRLLHRRRRVRRRGPPVRRRTSTRPTRRRSLVGPRRARCCCWCCPGSPPRSRRSSSPSSAPRSSPRSSTWRPRASRSPVPCPRASRSRPSRGRAPSDVGPLLIAAIGITLVSLTDTIATATSFAARRGDEVDPTRRWSAWAPSNIAAGFFQGFAISTSGSRTAVAEQSGAKSQVTGLVGAGVVAAAPALLQLAARRPPADRARRRRDRRRVLADGPVDASGATRRCAGAPLADLAGRDRRASILFGVLQGIVVAVVLSILLFFRRNWWPHGEVLGQVDELEGWHSIDDYPEATETPGVVVYRWEAPLFFANAASSASRSATSCATASRAGSCCSARRSPTSTSPRPRCSSDSTSSSTPRASTWRSSSCAAASRTSSSRYGLDETLDRDHFYPSIDAALTDIAHVDSEPGPDDP